MNRLTLLHQMLKFGITGFLNTFIDFGVFNLLVYLTGIDSGVKLGLINALAVALAATNSYLLNRNWTFKGKEPTAEQPVFRFILATGIGILINSAAVTGLSSLSYLLPFLPIYVVLNGAKIMGAGFSICWNFVSYRNWVFTWHPVTAAGPEYPEIVPDLVSIIIPAYNESRRLPRRLERLAAEALQRFPAEIVVVNDGSSDNTGILMEEIASRHSIVRCLHHDVNMGKGAAVRTGMLASRGEYTVFVDADETFSIDHIEKVVRELQNGHKVAIGARRLEGGGRVAGESPLRYIMGKAFNFYVQTMVLAGVSDTQCGLKGFHGQVARQVFPRQRMNGFAFDVEILALVRELGYEMVMVPVQAEDCDGSSVNRWLSPLQMAWDVLSIKTGLLFDYYDLPSRRQWLPQLATASALFVTALAVRIPWLWSIPRYIDELKEVNLAYSIYTGKLLPLTNMAHDIGSMHNYILAGIFKLFGASIYWPRLYVAVTAALTVVLVYRVGEKLFDRWTGLLAAAFLMTNGMHIMVTHMAWANSTTPFFFMLALLAMINAEQRKSGPWLVMAGFLWAATLQTHSSVIIYILFGLVYVFSPYFRRTSSIKPGWYAGAAVVFLLGYSNMIYYNIITKGGSFTWLGRKTYALETQPGLVSFLDNLKNMLIELLRSLASIYTDAGLLYYLIHPAFIAALILLIYGAYLSVNKKQLLPLGMIAAGLLIIPWLNSRYTFYLATRYIMPIIICSLLLMACAVVDIIRRLRGQIRNPRFIIAPAALLLLLLVGLQLVPFYQYCARWNNSNLSNRVALDTVSLLNRVGSTNKCVVLVEKNLHMENQPLPYLLTLSHLNYVLIPAGSGLNAAADPWTAALKEYGNYRIMAVMNKTTYQRLKNDLRCNKAYTFSSHVVFPRTLTQPREIYVLDIYSQNGLAPSASSASLKSSSIDKTQVTQP